MITVKAKYFKSPNIIKLAEEGDLMAGLIEKEFEWVMAKLKETYLAPY